MVGINSMELSRVLLVDDNPEFLALSQEFLGAYEGLQVIGTASSAQEALVIIGANPPTLVITDLVMPDISGLELVRMLKHRSPHLGVIIMTMMDTPYHRKAALSAGADAFVGKATMDADLIPAIRTLQRRLPQELS